MSGESLSLSNLGPGKTYSFPRSRRLEHLEAFWAVTLKLSVGSRQTAPRKRFCRTQRVRPPPRNNTESLSLGPGKAYPFPRSRRQHLKAFWAVTLKLSVGSGHTAPQKRFCRTQRVRPPPRNNTSPTFLSSFPLSIYVVRALAGSGKNQTRFC
jgi:hypothetical protein